MVRPPSGPGFSLPRAQRGSVSERRAAGWPVTQPQAGPACQPSWRPAADRAHGQPPGAG